MDSGRATILPELNDDCYDHIIGYLGFQDQIHVAQTCKGLLEICLRIWKRNPHLRTMNISELRYILDDDEADLSYYLNVRREHFTRIEIVAECLNSFLKDLEDLGVSTFPNISKCEFRREWTLHCYPSDNDIEGLTNLLPNLTYLRITAPITGKYLKKLIKLEELHLYEDQTKPFEIDNQNFHDICNNLTNLRVLDIQNYERSFLDLRHISKLSNLEVLRLNLSSLKSHFDDVMALPKLKTLSVLLEWKDDLEFVESPDTYNPKIYETVEFYKILNLKGSQITGIMIDNYYMPLEVGWDENMAYFKHNNLRMFALSCWESRDTSWILEYAKIKSLKILSCRYWTNLDTAVLVSFMKLCPDLEVLDLCFSLNINNLLLKEIAQIFKQHNRSKPFYINCIQSGLEMEFSKNYNYWRERKIVLVHQMPFPPETYNKYTERGYQFDFL